MANRETDIIEVQEGDPTYDDMNRATSPDGDGRFTHEGKTYQVGASYSLKRDTSIPKPDKGKITAAITPVDEG